MRTDSSLELTLTFAGAEAPVDSDGTIAAAVRGARLTTSLSALQGCRAMTSVPFMNGPSPVSAPA